MTTSPTGFLASVFRAVYSRWPKNEEFREWNGRLEGFSSVSDKRFLEDLRSLSIARDSLQSTGLDKYGEEVYWTSVALLMKQHEDEEGRDE